jgi:hypothetical protein
MKNIFILIIIVLAFNFSSFSQTLTLEVDNTGLPCHYMFIDVTASGFPTNVAGISLFIDVNGDVVQCIGKQNGVISPNVNQSEYNEIGIVWSNPAGASINGKLVTLVLHYDGGSSGLNWADSCEVVTNNLMDPPIICTYVNGSVSQGSYTFNTYYVDAARPSSGDGLSWGTAFKTIAEAANIPPKSGEQVLIKPGTYAEKVVIKSDGGYSVLPKTGVILSDTNKITFPNGANLSCVDLVSFPDQYYAYVYRSWNSNNGYYKITEVNDAQNYVRVSGASFVPETGAANNRGKVMAALGRPIVYKKDPTASESQRVIIDVSTKGAVVDAFYIGKAIGDGQTNADSSNFNIIEGIDITTGTNANAVKGLHIQCSGYNVYAKGKIYTCNGIGAILTGTSGRQAKYNILQNNEIYNTPFQGVLLGYTTNAVGNNFSNFNHILDNNFYLSGSGTFAKFNNAIKVGYGDKSNVVDGNNFHDFSINAINNGALLIESKADSTLVYGNIFRNIGKVNTGVHACIMVNDSSNKVNIFNNIIFTDDTVYNAVYAFRIDGKKHSGSKVAFNTIYKIENAFYLEDNGVPTLDFGIQNNIISPTALYFTNIGTSGRFTVTYNLFRSSPGAPYESGTGNIIGNPLFIEPESDNIYGLMLTPESPAQDTGIAITNITRDYLGILRDTLEPTLGAFENTMECYWTGAVNTDWHNILNWQLKMVPKTYMNVYIPNVTNDPVVSFNNAVCKSLNLSSGASFRVQLPRTITINN